MNKSTIYLNFLLILLALTGCEKEHTGYLFTENARFPIDTLRIIRYEDYHREIIQLEAELDNYSEEIRDSLNSYNIIEEQEAVIIEELDRLEGIMNKCGAVMDAYLDQFADESDADPVKLKELEKNTEDAYEAWATYQQEVYDPVYQIKNNIRKKIIALCQEAGKETPFKLAQDLAILQKQQSLDIPWTTSCIEQLLGTEPIIYTLENLRSDQGEAAAADFAKYLTVIGGGRMYVDTRVNSPAGKYIVSLRVSNDGYSVVLPDVFTFILQ
ncbi:MAG: hypothetical protein K2I90_01130 [Odoribacter sp.]|nr:hypothetical protein [Odoribacter sp.]